MRGLITFILFLIAPAFMLAQGPVITQSAPVVNQGATLQFIETLGEPGTWSCAGTDNSGNSSACHGSITAGGLYTAPASVTSQQMLGGFQLLPNNHIFNTRIDSLSVNANNTTWMNVVNTGTGQPSLGQGNGFPINFLTAPAPTDTMSFFYTSVNNGVFEIPQFPLAKLQGGWFSARYGNPFNVDHHILSIDTGTGVLYETYQYYPSLTTTAANVGTPTANVATLTVPLDTTKNIFTVGENVCVGSFSGADTFFNVCPVGLTAVTPTTISYSLTHVNASATSNGQVTANTQTGSCSTTGACNSQSGEKYNYSDYALVNAPVNAAGTSIVPLIERLQEVEQAVSNNGTVNHAIAMTFSAPSLASSFIWPATANAADGGTVPFGARLRLKSSFNISGFSAIAQVFLKQLQQYGAIAVDGGTNWDFSFLDANVWPANYVQAMTDVNNAGISCTITNTQVVSGTATITCPNSFAIGYRVFITGTTNDGGILNNAWYVLTAANSTSFQFTFGTNFASAADSGNAKSGLANYMEFVDESSLQPSANQTCPTPATCGLTTLNREKVTFTRTSDSATATVDVALQGVAVGVPQDYLYIMAGTPSQQLKSFVNIGSVTWSMSPAIGSLTSGGLYTAPTTLASSTTTTFTATSTVNAAISAQINVTVFPNTAIRVVPSRASNFTDSAGNVWTGGVAVGTNQTSTLGSSPSCSCPAVTDHQLWDAQIGYSSVSIPDNRLEFLVPNGPYQITYRYGTTETVGTATNKLSTQGNVFYTGDLSATAGGQNNILSEVVQNVVVTDNNLRFVVWRVSEAGSAHQPISSLSIIPGASVAQAGHLP